MDKSISFKLAEPFLGKEVEIVIDRPFGSRHPKYPDEIYEINAGYIPGIIAPDGKELDAYYLGANEPLKTARGVVIAIIHRLEDDDDKLVVVPPGEMPTIEEIEERVYFQEKYFKHEIIGDLYLSRRNRASAVILRSDAILLIKRIKNGKEYYIFPGGGVNEGEALAVAMTREIKEELNLEAEVSKEIFTANHPERGDNHFFLIEKFSDNEPRLIGEELDRFTEDNQYIPEWVNLSRLQDLVLYPEEAKEKLIDYLKNE